MLRILVLTATLAVATAVPLRESHDEPEPMVDLRYGGPSGILRFMDEHADAKDHGMVPDIEEQKKIIEKTYSPAFLQQIWILDYRLTPLKGRHYKTKFGSHVLILPKDNREHGPDVHFYKDNEHRDHRNEHSQEIELNRLRQLSEDYNRRRVVHKDEDERERAPHHGWSKGYNPGWAMLPNVKFAGRNHH